MRYKGTYILSSFSQRFMIGGDIAKGDGTGACSVNMRHMYDKDNELMEAEQNKLKFCEPYLLTMAANKDNKVGSQFMITLSDLPILDRSDLA